MMALQLDRAAKDMSGAVDEVRRRSSADKVGVVGFCMGGGLALVLATQRPDAVAACVAFYGLIPWPEAQPDFSMLSGAVLAHVAGNDEYFSPEAARALEEQLRGLGKDAEFHVYEGVDHAFFNDTRPEVYDAAASAAAWARTIGFFRAHLGARLGGLPPPASRAVPWGGTWRWGSASGATSTDWWTPPTGHRRSPNVRRGRRLGIRDCWSKTAVTSSPPSTRARPSTAIPQPIPSPSPGPAVAGDGCGRRPSDFSRRRDGRKVSPSGTQTRWRPVTGCVPRRSPTRTWPRPTGASRTRCRDRARWQNA